MHRLRSLLRPSVVAVAAALVFLLAYSVDTRAFSLDPRRWPTTINTYRIDQSLINCGGAAWSNAAIAAANEWTTATFVDFVQDSGSVNLIKCETFPGISPLAEMRPVYFPFEPYSPRFDIVVNNHPSIQWYTGTGTPPSTHYDLRTVLRHEFGHAAGLGHSATDETLMHRTVEPGRVYSINDDNRRGLDYYYAGMRWDTPNPQSEETFYIGIGDNVSTAVGYAYNGWQTPVHCSYCTLNYRSYSNVQGATAWFAFQGSRITYQFSQHPSRGVVYLYLDKNLAVIRDLNSLYPIWGSAITLETGFGNHIVEVVKVDSSGSIYMDLDAFVVDIPRAQSGGGALFFDDYNNNPYVTRHSSPSGTDWQVSTTATGAHQNTTTFSSVQDAALSFTFRGTGIQYWFTRRNDRGIARVTIDGIEKDPVDHYGPYGPPTYPNGLRMQSTEVYALSQGTHTIVISVSGARNQLSDGYVVDVDGFTIYP